MNEGKLLRTIKKLSFGSLGKFFTVTQNIKCNYYKLFLLMNGTKAAKIQCRSCLVKTK